MANGLRLARLRLCLVLEARTFFAVDPVEMERPQVKQAFLRSRQLLAVFAAAVALSIVKNGAKTSRDQLTPLCIDIDIYHAQIPPIVSVRIFNFAREYVSR